MRRFRYIVFPLALLTTPLAPTALHAQAVDSARGGPPFFTYRDAVLLGIFGVGALAMRPLDKTLASHLQEPAYQNNHLLHNTSTFFRLMGQPAPQIIGLGLYGVGRLTHNDRITKLAVHGSEAMILSTTATTLIKVMAGRARPRVDSTKPLGFHFMRGLPSFLGGWGAEYQSFPSGHATTAFAVASAATAEYSHWADSWHSPAYTKALVGGVLYSGAALVGISRMYNNAHWASDVLTGAAIGTFAGIKTVRYNYRHPGNKVEKWLVAVHVVPGQGQAPAYLAVSLTPRLEPMPVGGDH